MPAPTAVRWSLLIFDWDGTLADSQRVIVEGMQEAIAALHLPTRTDAQIADLIGLGAGDGLSRLWPELDSGDVMRRLAAWRGHAPQRAAQAPLIEGVLTSLGRLHARGYQLAVATGKTRRGLAAALMVQDALARLFTWTRCADESRAKPDPAMVLDLLEASALPAERALVIGDTEYDVEMARGAGVAAVGVASGSHDAGRLRAAGALSVLSSVAALPGWLAARAVAP
ncbi:MAG TPA: HAD-IA family hydrolase [Nevskiaceae bacterium]